MMKCFPLVLFEMRSFKKDKAIFYFFEINKNHCRVGRARSYLFALQIISLAVVA